jgi:propane monooxygenase coupling protein
MTDDRFKSDPTSSNRSGVTLMNNQVGSVVAHLMAENHGVTVTELPSMIRVDGDEKIDFDFEEIMSTHYGRMVFLDDRVLLFANPEDAAEYIGFDLPTVNQ